MTQMRIKKILLITYSILVSTKGFCQKNIFTYINDLPIDSLNTGQRSIYDKLNKQDRYRNIKLIRINNIREIVKDGNVTLSFSNDGINNILLKTSNVKYINESEYSWHGKYFNKKSKNLSYADLTLVKKDGKFIGHIDLEKKSYEIYDLMGGVQVMCETNLSLYNSQLCATKQESTTSSSNQTATSTVIGPCEDGHSKILILYNQEAAANEPDIIGLSYLGVEQLNNIWSASYVHNSLDIAAIKPLSFGQTDNPTNDVNALASNINVQTLRNQYKAEIVVLLVGSQYSGAYGVAAEINASFSKAFAIVCTPTATTSRYSFAHEITHLFGGWHDNANCNCTQRGNTFKTGTGWFGWGGVWRHTLMANTTHTNERIPHLSSPLVQFMDVTTGDNSHDVSSEVNLNKYRIGSFYADPVASQYNITLDCLPNWNRAFMKEWICYAETCDKSITASYSWYISDDGFNWSLLTNLSFAFIRIPQWQRFIKCEIRDASNSLILSYQKTLVYHGMSGHAE